MLIVCPNCATPTRSSRPRWARRAARCVACAAVRSGSRHDPAAADPSIATSPRSQRTAASAWRGRSPRPIAMTSQTEPMLGRAADVLRHAEGCASPLAAEHALAELAGSASTIIRAAPTTRYRRLPDADAAPRIGTPGACIARRRTSRPSRPGGRHGGVRAAPVGVVGCPACRSPSWRCSRSNAVLIGWRADVVRAAAANRFALCGDRPAGQSARARLRTTSRPPPRPMTACRCWWSRARSRSTSPRVVEVPRLRFALRNRNGQEVYTWTALPGRSVLAPGETLAFRSRLASPPADGERRAGAILQPPRPRRRHSMRIAMARILIAEDEESIRSWSPARSSRTGMRS